MENRQNSFISKFTDAQKYLGGNSIHDLVSIKYRDNVGRSSYQELIKRFLMAEMDLEVEEVMGDFSGRAWLVQDNDHNKALLVEHETGLEILYLAGSIASLISLIPPIISGWRFVRSRFSGNPSPREIGIEIRVINNNDHLLERRIIRVEDYILSESMSEIAALKKRVEQLEYELRKGKENRTKKRSNKKILHQ